jgi:serine/threonine-protein kinase
MQLHASERMNFTAFLPIATAAGHAAEPQHAVPIWAYWRYALGLLIFAGLSYLIVRASRLMRKLREARRARRRRRAAFGGASDQSSLLLAARSFDRYEVAVPLKQDFRFAHEPVYAERTNRFVGRQTELDALVERLLFSLGGAFLVTGYRGVGKTSFVNQVIRKLEDALPSVEPLLGSTEILDIQLNLARPLKPAELMHHIIRRLYARLVERGIFPLLDAGLREEIVLAHQRTSVNMSRQQTRSSEWGVGFEEAGVEVAGGMLGASFKTIPLFKQTRRQNSEMSYLGYDDKAAEYDIIRISRHLTDGFNEQPTQLSQLFTRQPLPFRRLKILFVFDELDKLEEFVQEKGDGEGEASKPVIDDILSSLKNLFTTSGISFIFVAGKDLQERWLEDLGRGDSVYESVFSYDKYLPCMWTDVGDICDRLLDADRLAPKPSANASPTHISPPQALATPPDPSMQLVSRSCQKCGASVECGSLFCRMCKAPDYARAVFEDFKKYLQYKGRGIPRRIIRGFNEYVQWVGQKPYLIFTSQDLRRVRFYASLEDVLERARARLFGKVSEEIQGTQQDREKLGVYYLVDWILRQGHREFTLKDAVAASKRLSAKIAPADEVAPGMIKDVFQILLENDYLMNARERPDRTYIVAPGEDLYRLTPRRVVEMGLVETSGGESYALGKEEKSARTIGSYSLLEEIGRGGMGTVYRAVHQTTGQLVAIKLLAPNLAADSEPVERFKREAGVMSKLRHPNIVRFYDLGLDGEQWYLVMDYAEGLNLQTILSQRGRLDLDTALSVAKTVASTFQYVHEQGFIRNDIKPANILLSNSGRIMITDFGIAKPREPDQDTQTLTWEGGFVGTPYYMAPEQFTDQSHADARSDIYSFGVLLYEMLTGVLPFKGDNVVETIRKHVTEPPPPPSNYAPVPHDVEALIMKCLEKAPADRFQSMAEVGAALRAANTATTIADLSPIVADAQNKVREEQQMIQTPTLITAPPPVLPAMPAPAAVVSSAPTPTPQPSFGMPPAQSSQTQTGAGFMPMPLTSAPPPPSILSDTMSAPADFESAYDAYLMVGQNGSTDTLRVFPLMKEKISIGRSPSNDLVLNSPRVSRFQASIAARDGAYFVEDLNSANGVLINGSPVHETTRLGVGDQIQLGDFSLSFNQRAAV